MYTFAFTHAMMCTVALAGVCCQPLPQRHGLEHKHKQGPEAPPDSGPPLPQQRSRCPADNPLPALTVQVRPSSVRQAGCGWWTMNSHGLQFDPATDVAYLHIFPWRSRPFVAMSVTSLCVAHPAGQRLLNSAFRREVP